MRRTLSLCAATVLLAAGVRAADAQVAPKQFDFGAHVGFTKYGSSASIKDGPFIGLDGTYTVPFNPLSALSKNTDFGIGFTFSAARPMTKGTEFPLVLFDVGDTTFLYAVSQRITLMHGGLQAVAGYTMGRSRIYGFGGGGIYTSFLDTRQSTKVNQLTHPMAIAGGGLNIAVSRAVGIRGEVRDLMFLKFDKNDYDPSVKYARDYRIIDALPTPPPSKSRIDNLQFSIVFSYIPNFQAGPGGAR